MKKLLALILAALLLFAALPAAAEDLGYVNVDGLNLTVPADWGNVTAEGNTYYFSDAGDLMMIYTTDIGIDLSMITDKNWENAVTQNMIMGMGDTFELSEQSLRQLNEHGQKYDMIVGMMNTEGIIMKTWILLADCGSKITTVVICAADGNEDAMGGLAETIAAAMYFDEGIAAAAALVGGSLAPAEGGVQWATIGGIKMQVPAGLEMQTDDTGVSYINFGGINEMIMMVCAEMDPTVIETINANPDLSLSGAVNGMGNGFEEVERAVGCTSAAGITYHTITAETKTYGLVDRIVYLTYGSTLYTIHVTGLASDADSCVPIFEQICSSLAPAE